MWPDRSPHVAHSSTTVATMLLASIYFTGADRDHLMLLPLAISGACILTSPTFTATGGAGGYTFTATGIPTWLNLATGGALTGTPPMSGPVTFSVTVTDSASNMLSQMFTLPVNSALTMSSRNPSRKRSSRIWAKTLCTASRASL